MYDFPIVIDDDSPVNDDSTTNVDDMSYGVYTRMSGGAISHNVDASANIANSRVFHINDPMRYNLDNTSSYVHQLGQSPYPSLTPTRLQAGMMTQPANMKSMYPELYPYVMREEVNGTCGTRVEDVASSSSLRSWGNIMAVPDGTVMESFGKNDDAPKGNMTVAEQKIMALKKQGKWPMKAAFRTKVRNSEDDLRDALEAVKKAKMAETVKVTPPSSITKLLEEDAKGMTSKSTPLSSTSRSTSKSTSTVTPSRARTSPSQSRTTPSTTTKEGMNVNTIRQLREGFTNPIEKEADYMYLEALKVRALAVCSYLKSNQLYSKWSSNWGLLEGNLNRNGYLFERLDDTDADIAYVINKGSNVRFRIRDARRYVPLNIYQYVLYHEMAHMSTLDLQHTEKFQQLLSIISLAGFELGFIDMSRIGRDFYNTNGQPITSRSSMKDEIISGAELLMEANPDSKEYYESIIEVVERA